MCSLSNDELVSKKKYYLIDYDNLVIEIQLSKDKIHVMSFSHECIKFIAKKLDVNYLQGVKIHEVNNGNLEIDRYQSSTTKRMFTTTSVKKNDSKEMGATCKHACFLSPLQIPCLHCTNQYTVSLKMFAQGGIVTLNSINHLSPLLINANCEKE